MSTKYGVRTGPKSVQKYGVKVGAAQKSTGRANPARHNPADKMGKGQYRGGGGGGRSYHRDQKGRFA